MGTAITEHKLPGDYLREGFYEDRYAHDPRLMEWDTDKGPPAEMCTISRMVTLEKRRILMPSACMGDVAQVPTHCGCGADWARHGAKATTRNATGATR